MAVGLTGAFMSSQVLATYWSDRNVQVNALYPAGVLRRQGDEFVEGLKSLILLG